MACSSYRKSLSTYLNLDLFQDSKEMGGFAKPIVEPRAKKSLSKLGKRILQRTKVTMSPRGSQDL